MREHSTAQKRNSQVIKLLFASPWFPMNLSRILVWNWIQSWYIADMLTQKPYYSEQLLKQPKRFDWRRNGFFFLHSLCFFLSDAEEFSSNKICWNNWSVSFRFCLSYSETRRHCISINFNFIASLVSGFKSRPLLPYPFQKSHSNFKYCKN